MIYFCLIIGWKESKRNADLLLNYNLFCSYILDLWLVIIFDFLVSVWNFESTSVSTIILFVNKIKWPFELSEICSLSGILFISTSFPTSFII